MAIRRSTRDVSLSLADSTVMPRANVLASLVEGVILSWGWRRRAIAFVSGAAGALALPPFSLFALIAAPLTIAVWLIDGAQDRGSGRPLIASMRAAFGAGWWMGFGYFLAGLWWVGAAFLVEADKFAWALPLGVVALPAVLAVFPGRRLCDRAASCGRRDPRAFSRSPSGSGSPSGRAASSSPAFPGTTSAWRWAQSRAGPDRLARRPARADVPDHRHLRRARDAVARRRGPAQPRSGGHCRARARAHRRIRRVQARGAGQRHAPGRQAAPDPAQRRPGRLVLAGKQGPDPAPLLRPLGARDSAGPIRGPRRDPPDLARVGVPVHPIARPAGARRHRRFLERRGDADHRRGAARGRWRAGPRYFNSIEIVGRNGLSAEHYDKQHLVPFGEYMPFENLLEKARITQFVDIPGGFEPGAGRRVLRIPGLPDAMPLVCYEAIFPIEIGDLFSGAERPRWLLNVTDDAWFGQTPGPYQHFAQARLRAIELGAPLVRDANSGISAVARRLRPRDRRLSARRGRRARRRIARGAPADLAVSLGVGWRGADRIGVPGGGLGRKTPQITGTGDCNIACLRAIRASCICIP